MSKLDIRALGHSALVDLREPTGETVHLGVLRGDTSVLYLAAAATMRVAQELAARVG